MQTILEVLTKKLESVFEELSYDGSYAIVGVSNRSDLCEFQCNGAMSLAKIYKKSPLDIATEIVEKLKEDKMFSKFEAVAPGFINISVSNEFLASYLQSMSKEKNFGIDMSGDKKKIIVDYGGANVAKPLHVGHLRSAIIGESIKRLGNYFGNEMIGDVHLGDWGLQMGLIIEQLKIDKPDLVYFDENFKLKKVVDFGNNMQHIDISTVDENKIKEEIYENFKPILEELENNEPDINLQWIFNLVYRDRIK